MFDKLREINSRPEPFQFYTAESLWTNDHTAQQMLTYHLNEEVDLSSRNKNFIEASCNWIADRFNIAGKKVADFGCGPGLYATKLAEKGAIVTGIDFSVNSINHAKKVASEKELEIDYVVSDYLKFETSDKFDLIVMIMCDFCALSPTQRQSLLAKFKKMLKTGGHILLDVYALGAFDKKKEAASYELNQLAGFWSPDDYYAFVNTFKYEVEKVVLDKYTIIEANRERVVYNWLQHFSPDALQAEFNQSGLVIKEKLANVAGGDFDPNSDEFAIIAGH